MEIDEELPSLSVNIERQKLDQLSRKDIKTQEVINELIHTEQKHVRNLKIMDNHFYVPIKVNMYLTKDERDILFPNLQEVLEIHSNFNNKLKKLRKENYVVPVKQLIDVILEQFKGEQGDKFQTACAKFCENQSQAMKLLQLKLKNSDKFSQFINNAENHSICRKLQLKDFIPTEVQRLVKYRLLFNELTKSVSDEDDLLRLTECVEASSKISSYVNKAVTECENRKRNEEIQSRIDTREFDQFCTKSPLLIQYKNLDLRQRKLIYEGELEWKVNNTIRYLIVFLYEDILVLVERLTEEKRRYILKPLNYLINKSKTLFSPVIPLVWIDSFRPMSEKRLFHLVAINREHKDSRESSSSLLSSSKQQMQNQILFIFVAKSGDERNKWCTYLQDLTGKISQPEKQAAALDRQQSSASSLLSHSVSNTTLSQSVSTTASNTLNQSLSSSTLNTTLQIRPINVNLNEPGPNLVPQISVADETKNRKNSDFITHNKFDELNENSKSIIKLLKERHTIMSKLVNKHADDDDLEVLPNEASLSQSQTILNNSTLVLTSIIETFINEDINKMKEIKPTQSQDQSDSLALLLANKTNLIKNFVKLETYLTQLHSNLSHLKQQEEDQMNKQCLPNLKLSTSGISSNSLNIVSTRPLRNDLSEDEQINYLDRSEQTLVVMSSNSVITESVNLGDKNLDADDEDDAKENFASKFKKVTYDRNYEIHEDENQDEDDEDEIHTNGDLIEDDEEEYRTPENEKQDDKALSDSSISIQIKTNDLDSDLELGANYRVPTPPRSQPSTTG